MDVPRPTSSRITKLRSVAREDRGGFISTMKVERPRARLSDAPTRLNSPSTRARLSPIAQGRSSPRLRQQYDERVLTQKVDLPPILGPGNEARACLLTPSTQSLATKG